MATHNPGFDNDCRASSSAPSEADDQEDWEADETLTPQERMEIGRQRSEYERTRSYNIIRNKKKEAAIDLQVMVSNLFNPGDR